MIIEFPTGNNFENEPPVAAKHLYESVQKLAATSRGTRNIEMWGMFAWSVLANSENNEDRQAAQIQLATISSRAMNEVMPTNGVESPVVVSTRQLLALSRIALFRRTEL